MNLIKINRMKIFFILIFSLCIQVSVGQDINENEIKNEYFSFKDMNNESLIFMDNFDPNSKNNMFSINKSFIKTYDGYKNIFPEFTFAEISYYSLQFNDKNYSLNWLIKDDILYLTKADGLCEENNLILKNVNGYNRIEKFLNRKFDIPFKENKDFSNFADKKIMKADWVNGIYYVHQKSETNKELLYELKFKNGELVYKKTIN